MSYPTFTFLKLKKNYGLIQRETCLFDSESILPTAPSARLEEDMQEGKAVPLMTSKAKSEAIIYPIIKEIKRKNPLITIFSAYSLNIEGDRDLNGNPDFMISALPQKTAPEAPIFCLVESKNGLIEEGYAQCAAEMYAAHLFNQENNFPHSTIYGAVTNAYDWVFLRLESNVIYIDTERYFLNDLARILGIFQFIIKQYPIE
ncbi:MAG: hypothetical protein JNM36_14570 [Chitinophagales bacterium]|nr:hypothetical protein [Chitinophagales bacterium]